jgi:transmembrane sensor
MENKDIVSLLEKYNLGTCSSQEKAAVDHWYNNFASRHAGLPVEEGLTVEMELIWNNIQAGRQRTNVVRFYYKRYALAAALAAAIFGAGLFYFNSQNAEGKLQENQVATADIAPGKIGATLILSNGKKIKLTDAANGNVADEAGVSITKSANGKLVYEIKGSTSEENQINTLSTSNGETYQVKLPDGSLVWLNAASTLTYTTALTEGGRRKVKLAGEAYFEVTKDKSHPFIVESHGQEVEVLGTHFNINAYSDEPAIATTLLEGAVKVTAGARTKVLKPGEQALNKEGSININNANMEKVTDWKSGEFYVNHIDFKTAMRKIARWYDVEVIYNSSVPDDMEIGGWVSRDEQLSSVLKSIESAGLVHFKVEGRKIYVTK